MIVRNFFEPVGDLKPSHEGEGLVGEVGGRSYPAWAQHAQAVVAGVATLAAPLLVLTVINSVFVASHVTSYSVPASA